MSSVERTASAPSIRVASVWATRKGCLRSGASFRSHGPVALVLAFRASQVLAPTLPFNWFLCGRYSVFGALMTL